MFFLAKGHCDVLVKDQHNIQSSVRLLKTGMLFGEVALIATSRRTASVRALNYCTIAALSASHFLALHNRFPALLRHLKRAMIQYRDPWKCYLKRCLQGIPHFSHVHAQALQELVYSLRQESYEKGAIIFSAGRPCSQICIVSHGTLQLVLELDSNQQLIIDTLKQDSILNCYSWHSSNPLAFTLRAKTNATVQFLHKDTLADLSVFDEIRWALRESEEYVKAHGVPLCDITLPRQSRSPMIRFEECVRKVRLLNYFKSHRKLKITEIMDQLQEQQRKEALRKKTSAAKKLFRHKVAHFISKELKKQRAEEEDFTLEVNKLILEQLKVLTDRVESQGRSIEWIEEALRGNEESIN